jgi:hypothetical protein
MNSKFCRILINGETTTCENYKFLKIFFGRDTSPLEKKEIFYILKIYINLFQLNLQNEMYNKFHLRQQTGIINQRINLKSRKGV